MADGAKQLIIDRLVHYLVAKHEISPKGTGDIYKACQEHGIGYIVEFLTTELNCNSETVASAFTQDDFSCLMYPKMNADDDDSVGDPELVEVTERWLYARRGDGSTMIYLVNPLDRRAREEALGKHTASTKGVIARSRLLQLAGHALCDPEIDEKASRKSSGDDRAARTLDEWLRYAATHNASDIHMEPRSDTVLVRMRIDGVLTRYRDVPYTEYLAVANVILSKCKSGTAGSYSQILDDEFTFDMPGRRIKLRVAMTPTVLPNRREEQPKFTLRLLGNNLESINLERIGLPNTESNPQLMQMRMLCERKHGIILVSGPTGSGKTTTLSAVLQEHIKLHPDDSLYTVEDPVEIPIVGANQVKVNEKAGVTFASALKSFLRGDPDVIMVGEIRDLEVAQEAIRGALTGHLVFSTIHTNSAIEAVVRLADLGIEPYKIAGALKAVQAQRLIKKLCPHCAVDVRWGDLVSGEHPSLRGRDNDVMRMKYQTAPLLYNDLLDYPQLEKAVKVRNPKGCRKCAESGYAGRVLVSELFQVTNSIEKAIARNATTSEINEIARGEGFREMWHHAMRMVRNGVTGFAECAAVLEERTLDSKMVDEEGGALARDAAAVTPEVGSQDARQAVNA